MKVSPRVSPLVAALLLVVALPAFSLQSAAARSVTVETTFAVDASLVSTGTSVWLAGLAEIPEAEPESAVLRWVNMGAWLPDWHVQIHAVPGLLDQAGADGDAHGREWVTLARATPRPDHRYRARIAYDPATGRLSASLHNLSTGEVVAQSTVPTAVGGLEVPLYEPDATHVARYPFIDSFEASTEYKSLGPPLSLQRSFVWHWVDFAGDAAQRKVGYEYADGDQVGLHVRWPEHRLVGSLRVDVVGEHETTTAARGAWMRGEALLHVAADRLPSGESLVRLAYEEDGEVWTIAEGRIRVVRARMEARVESFGRDEHGHVSLRVRLTSDDDLGVVPVTAAARYTRSGSGPGTGGRDAVSLDVVGRVEITAGTPAWLDLSMPFPLETGSVEVRITGPPGVHVDGGLLGFPIAAAPAFIARPHHERAPLVQGVPAALRAGEAIPEVEVRALRAGVLTVSVLRDGVFLLARDEYTLGEGAELWLFFDHLETDAPGLYETQFMLRSADAPAVRRSFFLYVHDDAHEHALEHAETRSHSTVFLGPDGRLVYVPDYLGNRVPDFSNAGYGGGGAAIPDVPVRARVEPGLGDDAARIQAAIAEVSQLPLGDDGFRGAVLLGRGTYDVTRPLAILAGGVVVRGEGDGPDGTVLRAHLGASQNVFTVRGPGEASPASSTGRRITDIYVPVGARTFHVARTDDLRVGETVIVRRYGNSEWIRAIGMDQIPDRPGDPTSTQQWTPFHLDFERVITEIDGDRVTVDAPLVNAVDLRHGGGELFKATDARIENVGVEGLRAVSVFDPSVRCRSGGAEYFCDERHAAYLVAFDNVKNAWARDVTAVHFTQGLAMVHGGAKWVTVQDARSLDSVSELAGSRRYPFHLQGQLNLVQRAFAETARHAFVVGARVRGPNVFLFTKSQVDFAMSEPHHRWSVGGLYDNVEAPIAIQDRSWYGTGHGWSGANYVTWNTRGSLIVQKPPTAQNWAFGHVGLKEPGAHGPRPDGHWESHGVHVAPRSLYLQQLYERRGAEALVNIGYAPVSGDD